MSARFQLERSSPANQNDVPSEHSYVELASQKNGSFEHNGSGAALVEMKFAWLRSGEKWVKHSIGKELEPEAEFVTVSENSFKPAPSELKQICVACGKPVKIDAALRGSITSWLFQDDRCTCTVPEVLIASGDTTSSAEKQGKDSPMQEGNRKQSQGEQDAAVESTIIDGRYKLHEMIGKGAMAAVYRGEHIATARPVAIKILSEAGNDESHARFKQEARAILAISHPNIVKAFDFGTLQTGESFLVMDFVQGTTLEKIIDEKIPLQTSEIVNIAVQVASGLADAHRCGVLHRDVKPSNIMLIGSPGSYFAKIVDFGLAKPVSGKAELRLTQTGHFVGTPLYMSPEQGSGLDLDERSDLYSLGCVLYELVTGEPPFLADNHLRLLHMHINQRPRSLKEVTGTSHNATLEDIILKLLEKDKTRRFQNANDLISALAQWQKKSTIFQTVRARCTRIWVDSNVSKSTLIILTFSLLGIVTLGSTVCFFCIQHGTNPVPNITTPNAPRLGESKTEDERPELTWSRLDRQAQRLADAGDYEQAKKFYQDSYKQANSIPLGPQYRLASAEGLSDLCLLTGKDGRQYDDEIRKLTPEVLDWQPFVDARQGIKDAQEGARFLEQSRDVAKQLLCWGRHSEAQQVIRPAVEVAKRLLPGDDLANAKCLLVLADACASVAQPDGEKSQELKYRMAAYRLFKKHPDSPDSQSCAYVIGLYYQDLGECARAKPFFEEALSAAQKVFGNNSRQAAACNYQLSVCYADLKQPTWATTYAHAALNILHLLPERNMDANAFQLQALLESGFKNPTAAARDAKRSLSELEKPTLKNYPSLAFSCKQTALFLIPLRRYSEAEPLLRRDLVILGRIKNGAPGEECAVWNKLGLLYLADGQSDKRKDALQHAVDSILKWQPHSQFRKDQIYCAKELAYVNVAEGDLKQAEKQAQIFKQLVEQEYGPTSDASVDTLFGIIYADTGRAAQGQKLLLKALAYLQSHKPNDGAESEEFRITRQRITKKLDELKK